MSARGGGGKGFVDEFSLPYTGSLPARLAPTFLRWITLLPTESVMPDATSWALPLWNTVYCSPDGAASCSYRRRSAATRSSRFTRSAAAERLASLGSASISSFTLVDARLTTTLRRMSFVRRSTDTSTSCERATPSARAPPRPPRPPSPTRGAACDSATKPCAKSRTSFESRACTVYVSPANSPSADSMRASPRSSVKTSHTVPPVPACVRRSAMPAASSRSADQ